MQHTWRKGARSRKPHRLWQEIWPWLAGTLFGIATLAVAGSLPPQTVFLLDYKPPLSSDSDLDSMDDAFENAHGLDPNDPADAAADYDGDGVSNADEAAGSTDPFSIDSDGDGLDDATERAAGLDAGSNTDADADGLPDDWELYWFGSLTESYGGHADTDALTNGAEFWVGSDPTAATLTDLANLAGLRVGAPSS